jgi:hypothetical protein
MLEIARGAKMAFIGTLRAGIPPNIAAVPTISHLELVWIGMNSVLLHQAASSSGRPHR